MNISLRRISFAISIIFVCIYAVSQEKQPVDTNSTKYLFQKIINNYINQSDFISLTGYNKVDSTTIDTVIIREIKKEIEIHLNRAFVFAPLREHSIKVISDSIKLKAQKSYRDYDIKLVSDDRELKDYVPNYFIEGKKNKHKDRAFGGLKRKSEPLIKNISKAESGSYNLYKTNIALWHSHGWYYEPELNRWEWQRARLFNTVEDLFPMAYTMNFLVPMLENSGANVLLPRERDWQTNEVVVDNDASSGNSRFNIKAEYEKTDRGFGIGNPPYVDENPFRQGTSLTIKSEKKGNEVVEWIPEIPEAGYYPVYISWQKTKNNTESALYEVHHTGGITRFQVNQQMGAGTWIYLGKFKFEQGLNEQKGKVVLGSGSRKSGQDISVDAVRFGGGMGNISRHGMVSGRPRYQEGARYYLQYAGIPDTLVWKLNQDPEDDYADDYQSRGEWVDYLMAGSTLAPTAEIDGLSIPVDLSLAFHTDAGITTNDTVIGTLGIYSTKIEPYTFESGISKMASRDLTDLIQTQIVDDIRVKYDPAWTRRGMWDRGYSEAYRPNTPTMLLELYSHQNFLDARFAKEPQFQFDVCRSIYKGIVKFLSEFYGIEYIIQPLPVNHFQTALTLGGAIELKWEAQNDPLEPTAIPTGYIVYKRENNNGYDNGTFVESNHFRLDDAIPGVNYSFMVAAVNRGGESLLSEELSACYLPESKETVLIINAFDRVGGAAWFEDENFGGFLDRVDQGVPYKYDFHTTGMQYDFNRHSPWLDDDSPGFGASYADMEDKVYPGNTFNFSFVHGESIKNAGYSFVTVSDEVVESNKVKLSQYKMIDFLAGEEKTSFLPKNDSVKNYQIYTSEMLKQLEKYLKDGGNLFISGAHIATDARLNGQDSIIAEILKFKWRTSSASRKGDIILYDSTNFEPVQEFSFNTGHHPEIYTVEAADALEPVDEMGSTLFRYAEHNKSAGVIYNGENRIVALGFPFETIISYTNRDDLMSSVIKFLLSSKSATAKESIDLGVKFNPTQKKLFSTPGNVIDSVSVVNPRGQLVVKTNNWNGELDLSHMATGMYIVQVQSNNLNQSFKIMLTN